jgi:hypothetical protein
MFLRRRIFYESEAFICKDSHEFSCKMEGPCSKLQGNFDCKKFCSINIRSLSPLQAAGNALSVAVQV